MFSFIWYSNMNWRKVRNIFQKEILDTLRDRRTILMMIVIPVLLYPGLLIFLNELAATEQAKLEKKNIKIALVNVPEDSPLLSLLRKSERVTVTTSKRPYDEVRDGDVHFVLEMPSNAQDLLSSNRTAQLSLHFDRSNEDATTNLARIEEIIDEYNQQLLNERLKKRSLSEEYFRPIDVKEVNVASRQKMGGFVIGRFLPMLMVIMVLAGSIYPAIDMTAGEKERGTLETILTSPATRAEIVTGKFLTVALIALLTGLLNLTSMYATFAFGIFKQASDTFQIKIPFEYVLIMVLCLVPLAVFFGGLMMAIASFARSFKEAQNLITPAYLVATLPAMISTIPGIRLEGFWLTLPVANVTLLFKELMLGNFDINHVLIVLFSVVFFAGVSIFIAVKLFGREEVLFGEISSFGLSFKRSNIVAKPVPEASEALFFTMIAMMFLLYVAVPAQAQNLIGGLIFTEVALFLGLPLAFSYYLKLDFTETFRLRVPAPRYILAAVVMFAGAEFCAGTVVSIQNSIFPLPEEMLNAMEKLLSAGKDQPMWLVLLATSILPAVCEETTFRGVVMSGMLNRYRPSAALVATGALFAVFHLSLHRFLPIFLLGWGIAYLTWKSGSIFTGMLLHLMNNGMAAVMVNYPQTDFFGLLKMEVSYRNFAVGLALICGSLYVSGATFLRRAGKE